MEKAKQYPKGSYRRAVVDKARGVKPTTGTASYSATPVVSATVPVKQEQFGLPFWLLAVGGAGFATQIATTLAGAGQSPAVLVFSGALVVAALLLDAYRSKVN